MELSFVIAGAQRSGTTTLCHLLEMHPRIRLARPLKPEPRLFLEGLDRRRWEEEVLPARFAGVRRAMVLGEKSTTYMEHPELAEEMRALFPGLRLLFLLRHPVERAVSNYRFTWQHGLEDLPFSRAVACEEERLATTSFPHISAHPHAYLRRGRYVEYLEGYLHRVERERIWVGRFEELVDDPDALWGRVLRFLGLEAAPVEGALPRRRHNPSQDCAVDLTPELLESLLEYFSPYNRRLGELLGEDFSAWDRPTPALLRLAGVGGG